MAVPRKASQTDSTAKELRLLARIVGTACFAAAKEAVAAVGGGFDGEQVVPKQEMATLQLGMSVEEDGAETEQPLNARVCLQPNSSWKRDQNHQLQDYCDVHGAIVVALALLALAALILLGSAAELVAQSHQEHSKVEKEHSIFLDGVVVAAEKIHVLLD